MSSNEGYALLIGVDDYAMYDASAGNSAGTSNLLGSRNDVIAFWRTCRDLDIAPANIRVLTSPRLDPSALPGALAENVGEATEQMILKGAAWLADAIGGTGAPGLLTFSGHGEQVEGRGLAICPADIAAPGLDRAISFETLRGVFAERDALGNLTSVIDACFAGGADARGDGAAGKGRRLLSLTGRRSPASVPPPAAKESGAQGVVPLLGDRVIAAARADQPAFQASFSGEHRGAFSWAVGAALDQWSRVRDGSSTRLNLSYGELRARTERLLGSLSFEQTPVLHGPANVAELAFFQRGSVPARTCAEPDAPRLRMQLDPGMLDWRKYVITANTNPVTPVAEIFAMRATVGNYLAGNEYWFVNKDALAALGSTSVSFAFTNHDTGEPTPPGFTNQQAFIEPIALTWETMADDPGSGGALFNQQHAYLRINNNSKTPPSMKIVTWYQVLRTGETPANLSPTGTFTVATAVSVGGGETGYYVLHNV